MTKFKVGDRVTLSGTVVEVDKSDWAPYGIKFDGGTRTVWFSDDATPEKAAPSDGLSFRDQAAIAALQGFCAADIDIPDAQVGDVARIAFDFADAQEA